MLKKIRGDVKKKLWILVIVISVVFILWGAPGLFKRESNSVGVIYGKKIDAQEFANFKRNIQILLVLNLGLDLASKISEEEMTTYTWQNFLFVEEAKREKIEVADSEVAKTIKSMPLLISQGGFSKERYLQLLKRLNTVPGQFEKFLKDR